MTTFRIALVVLMAWSGWAWAKVIEVPPAQQALAPETSQQRDARMAWWREARFGMFIHFGLYSVAAGEWNGVKTPRIGEWIMNDLHIPPGEYAQLAKKFNPTHFDARQWAAIAKSAGMKYIVITTKHHDGFCLFDSKFTDYDVMNTPFKRDIMKELSDATREAGLKIGWYHSIMDWHDPQAQSEETFASYEWHLRAQVNELLTHYGEIGVMWFDGEWVKPWNDERGKYLYTLCRTVQPSVIVNNRVGKNRAGMSGFTKAGGFTGDYATPEQQIPATVPRGGQGGLDWETCMTMNDTWGYKKNDQNWKSTQTLIRQLIEVASKGGNFLLNVGPTGEGEIPPASVQRLEEIGKWMNVNGESIHGTTAGPFDFALPFGRCTQKRGRLYLHVLTWPEDHAITVPVRNDASKAYLLTRPDDALEIEKRAQGVIIHLPAQMPDSDATVVALEIAGAPEVIAPVVAATKSATQATSQAITAPTGTASAPATRSQP